MGPKRSLLLDPDLLSRNLDELFSKPEFQQAVQDNPQLAKAEVKNELARAKTAATDQRTYRFATYCLGIVVILTLLAAFWLSIEDKALPDMLLTFGSTALGALAGLLAPIASTNA